MLMVIVKNPHEIDLLSFYKLPKLRRVLPDSRELELEIDTQRRGAAVIFYHRSLAHEKLGHKTAAERDFKLATEWLRREPDETLY